MAYLDNSTIVVDAILTKKGRELLSRGVGQFNITQFALADDEIDYGLWNPSHPDGTSYYGSQIENLPILEAFPDENSAMKYKLITLPKRTVFMPVVTVAQSSVTFRYVNQVEEFTPQTLNYSNANATFGYTAILSDSDACELVVSQASPITPSSVSNTDFMMSGNMNSSNTATTVSAIGLKFKLRAKLQLDVEKNATLTIIGNQTGGSVVIPIRVLPTTQLGSQTSE